MQFQYNALLLSEENIGTQITFMSLQLRVVQTVLKYSYLFIFLETSINLLEIKQN